MPATGLMNPVNIGWCPNEGSIIMSKQIRLSADHNLYEGPNTIYHNILCFIKECIIQLIKNPVINLFPG